jgi:glucose-6-phosphate 1-dehydrogenase
VLAERLHACEAMSTTAGRLFYLALPPQLYPTVAQQLHSSGCAITPPGGWVRLILEKVCSPKGILR